MVSLFHKAAEVALEKVKKEENKLGKAVKDGFVRFLSVSSIKKFDPKEEAGCPRAWWYRYVKGLKDVETTALGVGKIVGTELEHYLKTGEDVLSPIARAGKHLLPAPGPDLEVERPLGDALAAIALRDAGGPVEEVARLAGLSAGGIPLVGAPDLAHGRGEWVNAEGVLVREDPGMVVFEVIDHKTSSRIFDHISKSGEFYPGYAKSETQIASDTQMVGYMERKRRELPGVTHFRVGHIYYQTKGAKVADKRSSLLAVEEVPRRWDRIDKLVREIEQVALETDPTKIPINLGACNAYHKVCVHADYCPRSMEQMFTASFSAPPMFKAKGKEDETMSLFNKVVAAPAAAPAPQPTPTAADAAAAEAKRQAEIAAEKARLAAEDAARTAAAAPAPGSATALANKLFGPAVPVTACTPGTYYLYSDERVIYRGVIDGHHAFDNETKGSRYLMGSDQYVKDVPQPAAAAPVVTTVIPIAATPTTGAINPPDSPRYDLSDAADPLPPEVIAAIADPALRAKAAAHRASWEAKQSAGADLDVGGGGRCPQGNQRIKLTMEQVAERKYVCACGKEIKLKPGKGADGTYEATISGHNLPKPAAAPAPAPAATPAPAPTPTTPVVQAATTAVATSTPTTVVQPAAPAVAAVAAAIATVAAAPAETIAAAVGNRQMELPHTNGVAAAPGATIFLDTAILGGPQPTPLVNYYGPIVAKMAEEAQTIDIRCTSGDGPLGFGKWKGVLSALVKARPIAPGEYSATTLDEIEAIVAMALISNHAARGVRGLR